MYTKRHSGQTANTDRLPPISTTHPGHLGVDPERELWTTYLHSRHTRPPRKSNVHSRGCASWCGSVAVPRRQLFSFVVAPRRTPGTTLPHPSANTSLSAKERRIFDCNQVSCTTSAKSQCTIPERQPPPSLFHPATLLPVPTLAAAPRQASSSSSSTTSLQRHTHNISHLRLPLPPPTSPSERFWDFSWLCREPRR